MATLSATGRGRTVTQATVRTLSVGDPGFSVLLEQVVGRFVETRTVAIIHYAPGDHGSAS